MKARQQLDISDQLYVIALVLNRSAGHQYNIGHEALMRELDLSQVALPEIGGT